MLNRGIVVLIMWIWGTVYNIFQGVFCNPGLLPLPVSVKSNISIHRNC